MVRVALLALLIAYLPGALLYRLPLATRERRASLDAGERLFWAVMLSAAWSLIVVLGLAAREAYTFNRLLEINGALSLAILAACRGHLRYRATHAPLRLVALAPLLLVALGLWRFFPASEYIIGGKDPGTYMNEGIQIAQRGSIVIHDEDVKDVPGPVRNLFFPWAQQQEYYGLRFMGFYIQDPLSGTVIGQFPHLFPAAIAIGYGMDGLTGARSAVDVWAILGILAVYFAGARWLGRAPALAAAMLLGLHSIQVWFSRYPNSEVMMQAMTFAALLAFARAHQDDDAFFAPIAGVLLALQIFLRVDALLTILAIAGVLVASWLVDGRRPRLSFLAVLVPGVAGGLWYLTGPMRAYFWRALVFLINLPQQGLIAAGAGSIVLVAVLVWLRRRHAERGRVLVPRLVAVTLVGAAVYAYFFRHQAGKLTDYDALAFRIFTDLAVGKLTMILAVVGVVLLSLRRFWRDPAFVGVFASFSLFLFFKVHVVPTHFWMDRRFVPVILPGVLLCACGAIFVSNLDDKFRRFPVVPVILVGIIGWQFVVQAAPLDSHVEYAGIIKYVESLAGRFTDRDLVLIESRNAGPDTHVFAQPLAYIYAKHALVLDSPIPNKPQLEAFIDDARQRFDHVYFVGGGGTDLLSRHIIATPIADLREHVPEYQDSPWTSWPDGPRRKDFDASIYELTVGTPPATNGFSLDLGFEDDLNVLRFYAKEATEGRTIRWTTRQSFVTVPGMTGREQSVTFVMSNGGRPATAPPCHVQVYFNDTPIGSMDVGPGFQPYTLTLPPAVVAQAATVDEPARLRIVSTTFNPHALSPGAIDTRDLGVMVDRVDVR
jgi:hypothetical protein